MKVGAFVIATFLMNQTHLFLLLKRRIFAELVQVSYYGCLYMAVN